MFFKFLPHISPENIVFDERNMRYKRVRERHPTEHIKMANSAIATSRDTYRPTIAVPSGEMVAYCFYYYTGILSICNTGRGWQKSMIYGKAHPVGRTITDYTQV